MKFKKNITVILFLLSTIFGFSQTGSTKKLDKIIKRDYQIIECTISKISDKELEYSLPNESLQNVLNISQIARIDFSSGRSQTFDTSQNSNTPNNSSPVQTAANGEIKANTIAVLPIPYVNSDNQQGSEDMAKFAQNDLYNKLIDKSSNIFPLTVQDLRTTNSLLHKAGIDHNNIDDTPIEDLEKILGVDNIVAAKVSYTTATSTTSTGYNTGNVKISDNDKKAKVEDYSVANANTELHYYFTVYFDMYKNATKIYTQTRKPVFYFKDSWMDAVSYLLKRSPIYVKK
ncbi:hypothetical protein [Flavobacterium sp. 5]|uniref:hypothetical protein n=1 Tax=Flavobacterium sp. 5 TaxID=2035199 RepID=UPI000C2B934C|nr:hypothetical protein [Flavobacterium sp. 5]PKB15888.1 hypothetical protein CLU82_0993 [Flavobacterium sp. 5]